MLQIKRKTVSPSVRNRVHQTHISWRLVTVFGYNDTAQLFKSFNQGGAIETDAQFAKLLKDKFGIGTYLIIAFVKGRRGFYNFAKIELSETTFRQLPKRETPDEIAVRKAKGELNKLTRDSKKEGLSDEQKELIKDNLDSIKDDVELSKEIANLDDTKRGCRPYLKPINRIFFEHSYAEIVYQSLQSQSERRSII